MDPEGLGGRQVLVYEGTIPEASGDGITCVRLTIESREHSGDGTFTLERFYSEADARRREVSVRRGRRYTLRGIPENADATVWQLVTEEGDETINLLKEGGDTLTLLDAKQRILPSVSGFELILPTWWILRTGSIRRRCVGSSSVRGLMFSCCVVFAAMEVTAGLITCICFPECPSMKKQFGQWNVIRIAGTVMSASVR